VGSQIKTTRTHVNLVRAHVNLVLVPKSNCAMLRNGNGPIELKRNHTNRDTQTNSKRANGY
jgi:hypothetical protein